MSEGREEIIAMVVVALVIGILVFITGHTLGSDKVRREAIQKGFAEYNATTGEWQWKGGQR